MEHEPILFISKYQPSEILGASDETFDVLYTDSVKDGLTILDANEVKTIVVAPSVNELEDTFRFFEDVCELHSHVPYVLLINKKEIEIAYSRINKSNVFRALILPAEASEILSVVSKAVENYNLQKSNLEMLGNMKIMLDMLKEENSRLEHAVIQRTQELQATLDEMQRYKEYISASLSYASRIQNAILPFAQKIAESFDYFLFFRPKDEVSGDFYWYHSVKSPVNRSNLYHFIAVIDCTGHGVPGAFMSMIAYSLLNEVVRENATYEPKDILQALSQRVVKSLKQQETGNNDGMDICLCRIEKAADESLVQVVYAGAKRPLFHADFSEQPPVLNSIKGSVKRIGGVNMEHLSFKQEIVNCKKGDIVYLTTDGYGDQRSPEEKMIGKKGMLDVLTDNILNPMPMQKKALKQAFDEFKKDMRQMDDVCLMGVKL